MSGLNSGVTSTRTHLNQYQGCTLNETKKQRTLFQHARVKIVAIFFVLLAIVVALEIVSIDLLLHGNLSSVNAGLILETFKLPIGIIAAGLSLLLLFATQHRSEQLLEQINVGHKALEESIKQNTLKNYYDSINDFEKYISDNYLSDILEIKNKRQLYKAFFPKNSYEHVRPYITKETCLKNVSNFLSCIKDHINFCQSTFQNEGDVIIFQNIFNNLISRVETSYGISIKNAEFTDNPVDDYISINYEINKVLIFCMHYTPSNESVVISNSTIDTQEEWKKLLSDGSLIQMLKYVHKDKDGRVVLRYPNNIQGNKKKAVV